MVGRHWYLQRVFELQTVLLLILRPVETRVLRRAVSSWDQKPGTSRVPRRCRGGTCSRSSSSAIRSLNAPTCNPAHSVSLDTLSTQLGRHSAR
eukprot:1916294-Rhodomonas_salina.3